MSDRLTAIWFTITFIVLFALLVAACVLAAIRLWPWGLLFPIAAIWIAPGVASLLNDTVGAAIHNDILWKEKR